MLRRGFVVKHEDGGRGGKGMLSSEQFQRHVTTITTSSPTSEEHTVAARAIRRGIRVVLLLGCDIEIRRLHIFPLEDCFDLGQKCSSTRGIAGLVGSGVKEVAYEGVEPRVIGGVRSEQDGRRMSAGEDMDRSDFQCPHRMERDDQGKKRILADLAAAGWIGMFRDPKQMERYREHYAP